MTAAVKRLRAIASNGDRTFKIQFTYDDPSGKGKASGEITFDHCKDADHARHVFDAHPPKNKKNPKVSRVTEVKAATTAKKYKPQPLEEGKWYLFDQGKIPVSGPFNSKKEADDEKKHHLENIDDSPGLSVRQAKKGETGAAKKAVAIPKDVQTLTLDWKDINDEAVGDLEKALKTFGVNLQRFDDQSDSVLLTLSKTKLSDKQLKSLFDEED